jgi:predicted secreted Zn-dependent protease
VFLPRSIAALLVSVGLLSGSGCGGAAAVLNAEERPSGALAVPGLRVQLQERFYPVAGRSARALNQALAREGPRRDGRRAHALTEWRVAWSYVAVQREAACASSRPTVSVEIVTTLPRWVDLESAPERLVSDWALFLARLRDHESRHQYLALRGSRELQRTLAGLSAPDCEILHAEAQRVVATLAARYDAEHEQIDQRTPGAALR